MTLQNIWIPLFWSFLCIGAMVGFFAFDGQKLSARATSPTALPAAAVTAQINLSEAPLVMRSGPEGLQPTNARLLNFQAGYALDMLNRQRPGRPAPPERTVLPSLVTAAAHAPEEPGMYTVEAIEMMKAAAETTKGPTQSQLDVILAAMKSAPPPIERKTVLAPVEKPLVSAIPDVVARPLPVVARLNAQKAQIRPAIFSQRPMSRPLSAPPKRKRHDFDAQHYHYLRHHARALPSNIACVAELQLIAERAMIYFDAGSSRVNGPGTSAARLVAAKAQSCPEAEVSIIGFTDPGGSADLNLKLSWQRANAVFRSIEEAGFSTKGIMVSSHMEDHPEECLHYEGVDRRVIFAVQEKQKS